MFYKKRQYGSKSIIKVEMLHNVISVFPALHLSVPLTRFAIENNLLKGASLYSSHSQLKLHQKRLNFQISKRNYQS